MEIVEEAGTSFAYPSRMNYSASELSIDATRVEAAEEQVRNWRSRGKLAASGFLADDRHEPSPAPHIPVGPATVRILTSAHRDGRGSAGSSPGRGRDKGTSLISRGEKKAPPEPPSKPGTGLDPAKPPPREAP